MDNGPLKPTPAHRGRRWAIVGSLAFHVVLIAVLAVWYVRQRATRPVVDASHTNVPATAEHPAESGSPPTETVPDSPEVTPAQVSGTVHRAMEYHHAKSEEENLAALETQAKKLNAISSPESIDEIAEKFHTWMNTTARATAPADEPAAGSFDFRTAQFHDITRLPAEEGTWTYRATLIDAAGQTIETELPADEGRRLYATFAQLEQNPLADRVYRHIAMPLMDKMLNSRQSAAGQAQEDGRGANENSAAADDAEDDRDPFDDSP